jgi:hypothetical protein
MMMMMMMIRRPLANYYTNTTTVVATVTTSTATSKGCQGGNLNRTWNHDDGTRRHRLGRRNMMPSLLLMSPPVPVGFVSSCGQYSIVDGTSSRITKRFKNASSATSEDCEKHQQQMQTQQKQKKHRVIPDTRGIPDDVIDLVNVSPLLKTV